MAQSAVTVIIDSEIKSQFDKVCEQIGMSANTAFNVFVKAVVRTRSIPFEVKAQANTEPMSGLEAFRALRAEAQQNGLPEMTLDEINEEIRLAREEMAAKKKVKA